MERGGRRRSNLGKGRHAHDEDHRRPHTEPWDLNVRRRTQAMQLRSRTRQMSNLRLASLICYIGGASFGISACSSSDDVFDVRSNAELVVADQRVATAESPTAYWIVSREELSSCPDFLYYIRRYSSRYPDLLHVVVTDHTDGAFGTQLRRARIDVALTSTNISLPLGGLTLAIQHAGDEQLNVNFVEAADATLHPDFVSDVLSEFLALHAVRDSHLSHLTPKS